MLAACGPKRPPSPMKDEKIFSISTLNLALFDPGVVINRKGLRACGNEFPHVNVLEETEVHRALRNHGFSPEELLSFGDRFDAYSSFSEFHLLLIPFENKGQAYLRIVNFLGKYVSTVLLDVRNPKCVDLLRAQRLVVVDSQPPLADVQVDGRAVGEAPVWIWLKDGTYEVKCALPGQIFKPISVVVPKDVMTICQRENTTSKAGPGDSDEKMTAEEGAGSVLVYIVGAAATAAAIIIPLLFLF